MGSTSGPPVKNEPPAEALGPRDGDPAHRHANREFAREAECGRTDAPYDPPMTIPELIPIKRYAGYHTDTIGQHAEGQFFACITGAHVRLLHPDADLARRQRWYAVLHRFDSDGNHLGSDIEFAGTTADGQQASVDKAWATLDGWLGQLVSPVYGDIAVKLFEVEVDGVRFGLVDLSGDHGEHVELLPNHFGFYPPWNGSYDT